MNRDFIKWNFGLIALIILILAGTPFHTQAQVINNILTLDDAIQLAVKNNSSLRQQYFQIEAARQRLNFQKADKYPVLDIQTGLSHANEASRIPVEFLSDTVLAKLGTQNTLTARLQLHQTLTDFGKTKHSISAVRYELESQKIRYKQIANNVTSAVKQEYYKMITYQKLDSLYQSMIPISEKLAKINEERLKNGVALTPEVLRTQIDVQNLIARQTTATSEWNKSYTQLSILTGQDTYSISGSEKPPELSGNVNLHSFYDEILNKALLERQDIRVLELQQKKQKELGNVAITQKRPTLLLFGDFSYFGPEAFGYYSNLSSRGLKNYNWRIGLTLNYTLFDGFRSRSQKREALALQRGYGEATNDLKTEIGGRIKSILSELNNLRVLLRKNKLVYQQAKSSLGIYKASFENGSVSEQDYTEALIPAAYAEASLIETRYKMTQALIELEQIAGGSLPESLYLRQEK